MIDRDSLQALIIERYGNLQKQNDEVRAVFQSFGSKATLHIIGGWLRDIVHNLYWHTSVKSKDIDVVFQAQTIPTIFDKWERTAFGGYTKRVGNISLDVWRMEDTWTFTQGYLSPPSFANLMKSVSFTVDAIAFEIGANRLIGDQALRDIAARTLALNCKLYVDKLGSLQAFRAAKMHDKYGYAPTNETKVALRKSLSEDELKESIRREARENGYAPDEFVAKWFRKVTDLLG
jgi:hypothetical protein